MGPDSQSKDPRPAGVLETGEHVIGRRHHANPVISKRRKWTNSSSNKKNKIIK